LECHSEYGDRGLTKLRNELGKMDEDVDQTVNQYFKKVQNPVKIPLKTKLTLGKNLLHPRPIRIQRP
jgi:hypothetical protein